MGYYAQFPMPIPHLGVRSIVLLTLPPLSPLARFSFDLHVLAMPPAFNLSQDQTLQLKSFDSRRTGDSRLSGKYFKWRSACLARPASSFVEGGTDWSQSEALLTQAPDCPPTG